MSGIELCSAHDVGSRFGFERVTAVQLLDAGLFGDVYGVTGRPYVARDLVDKLAKMGEPPPARANRPIEIEPTVSAVAAVMRTLRAD